ncbi:MAG TPA: MATE family efflux transporter [Methylibium sp.]|nr:MATE family efflux transporter [Methylibium sp.]
MTLPLPAAARADTAIVGRIARHAASILVGQIAVIGYTVADTVMTGRHDSADLAALAIGAACYVGVYIALTGVMQALIPIVGHHHGAGNREGVRRSFQQGLWLSQALALPGVALLLYPAPILALAQADATVAARVDLYLGWLAWSLPAGLLFRTYSSLNQGLSRPLFVTVLQLLALALKLPLNAWLIFGGAGVPALGVEGCALATLIVQWTLAAVALLMLRRHPSYRDLRLFADWPRPQWPPQRELLRLGLPSGAALFFEVTGFALMAVFIARLGTAPLAGHQIVANVASVIYMLPLSIGIATAALASQAIGAGDPALARRAARDGLLLALGLVALISVALVALRGSVAALYSPDPAVQAVARHLLLLLAFSQLPDAAQGVLAFALRAWRVALRPAVAYAVGLWGVGLAGGCWLAFAPPAGWPAALSGPAAFWLANGLALLFVSALLGWMLQRASAVSERRASDPDSA